MAVVLLCAQVLGLRMERRLLVLRLRILLLWRRLRVLLLLGNGRRGFRVVSLLRRRDRTGFLEELVCDGEEIGMRWDSYGFGFCESEAC